MYVVRGREITPLAHPGYRSRAPFDWGTTGAGALELAFALLAHTTDSRPPDPICLTFRADVVARLDRGGFVLADGEIALWLLGAFWGAHDAGNDPPGDGDHGLRARVHRWLQRRRRC